MNNIYSPGGRLMASLKQADLDAKARSRIDHESSQNPPKMMTDAVRERRRKAKKLAEQSKRRNRK